MDYKKPRNAVKRSLTDAEKKYTFKKVEEHTHNRSSLGKIINFLILSKAQERRRSYTRDIKVVADKFNLFFSLVDATNAAAWLAEENNITLPEPSSLPQIQASEELFNFMPVTCEDVRRIMLKITLNKFTGPDKVYARAIKVCLPVILGPLTAIINCSLLTSTLPAASKKTEVIPIFKEVDLEVAFNRPLSPLAVANKICEKRAPNQFNDTSRITTAVISPKWK